MGFVSDSQEGVWSARFRYYAITDGIMALLTRHPARVKGIEGRRKDLQLTLGWCSAAEKLGEFLLISCLVTGTPDDVYYAKECKGTAA